MRRVVFLLVLLIPIGSWADVIYQESWEKQRQGGHINDVGANSTLRSRNNSCNSIDAVGGMQVCGNTCGNDNEDRCCRSNDPEWNAETNGSILEDWATARFNGGEQWTHSATGKTFTVPTPVDGKWVYRAYVADCSLQGPYRCNDFKKPVRQRALIASQSGNEINSAGATRWYGFATWIDPHWDLSKRDRYDGQTIASIHLPPNYRGGSGGAFRLNFRKGYGDRQEWLVVSMLETNNRSEAVAAGCRSPQLRNGKWSCGDRRMEILNPDGSPSGNTAWTFDHDQDTGQWLYWVVQIRQDPTGEGDSILRVWRRRQNEENYWKLIDYTGPVGPMSRQAGYWKMGISDKSEAGNCPKIIYYDAFTVGDHRSNFNEVDPSKNSVCSDRYLENCADAGACDDAGGYWCESTCRSDPCSVPAAPEITIVQPTKGLPYGTTVFSAVITTDQPSACRFQYQPDENAAETDIPFDDMRGHYTSTDGMRHTKELNRLKSTSWFFHDIKCRFESGKISNQIRSEIRVLPE